MWEHRAVSQKQFQESGRVSPSETYVIDGQGRGRCKRSTEDAF